MEVSPEAVESRGRLRALAGPCLVWGVAAVVLLGGLHVHYAPRAEGWDQLTAALTGYAAVGAACWTLPHAAVLWWLRRGGALRLWSFLVLGPLAALGIALLVWEVTSAPAAAAAGLVAGSWVFALELRHVRRLLMQRPEVTRAGAAAAPRRTPTG